MSRVTLPTPTLLTGRLVSAAGVIDEGALVLDGDRIGFAGPAAEVPAPWRDLPVTDAGPGRVTLLPGLVDVHCHGGAGGEFGADADSAATAVRYHHESGTTSLLGSLVSATARPAGRRGAHLRRHWWPPVSWRASTWRARSSPTSAAARRTRRRSPTSTLRWSRPSWLPPSRPAHPRRSPR